MKNKKMAKIVRKARRKLKLYGWRRGGRGYLTASRYPSHMCFLGAVDYVVGGDPNTSTDVGALISSVHAEMYGTSLVGWNDHVAKNEKDALKHLKDFSKKLEKV